MNNPIGPLGPADERFTHQIPDTFATVGSTDLAWTEKVYAMAAARDGRVQLGFGLGKYPNRNVMDAYGGISRGTEQITVRASRRLSPDPDTTVIGPLRYEVLEPMQSVRFALDANDVEPIAFDWTFEAALPPATEDRTHGRSPSGYRVNSDLVRYHQIGLASGWVEIDGHRQQLDSRSWVSTRDHSWGVRYDVGRAPSDLEPAFSVSDLSFYMLWCPILCERSDGSQYGIFLHLVQTEALGFSQRTVMGGVEHPDGRVERIADIHPELAFHRDNRRLLGGRIHLVMADGSTRTIEVEVPGDTGFHLGAGLYFGWKGHHHGEWRGALHSDGERLPDCTDPHLARELHQIRDTMIRVKDPTGEGQGWGNCQPIVAGSHPNLGLTRESSFI